MKKQLLALVALSMTGALMAPPKRAPQPSSSSYSSSSSSSATTSLRPLPREVFGDLICSYLDLPSRVKLGATSRSFRALCSGIWTYWCDDNVQIMNLSESCPPGTKFSFLFSGSEVLAIMPPILDVDGYSRSRAGVYRPDDGSSIEFDFDLDGQANRNIAFSKDGKKIYVTVFSLIVHSPSLISRVLHLFSSSSPSRTLSFASTLCCRQLIDRRPASDQPELIQGSVLLPGLSDIDITGYRFDICQDGTQMLMCKSGEIPKICDLRTGRLSGFLGGISHSQYYHCGFFSPNGKFAALSISREIGLDCVDVIDISSGEIVSRFQGHIPENVSVPFSPDGRQIATVCGSRDVITIWDISTGKAVANYKCKSESPVDSIQFSKDGSRFLIVHTSREIEILKAKVAYRPQLLQIKGSSAESSSSSSSSSSSETGPSEDEEARRCLIM